MISLDASRSTFHDVPLQIGDTFDQLVTVSSNGVPLTPLAGYTFSGIVRREQGDQATLATMTVNVLDPGQPGVIQLLLSSSTTAAFPQDTLPYYVKMVTPGGETFTFLQGFLLMGPA